MQSRQSTFLAGFLPGTRGLPCFLMLVFICLVVGRPLFAENAYSWKDKDGHLVYGSKPPSNAQSVTKLNTKPLSRYSTKKVLSRLGWDQRKQEQEAQKASSSATENAETIPQLLLSHGPVEVERNEKGEVISCQVLVKNTATIAYRDISVAFELIDGTLIPAVGPEKIDPSFAAHYAVPNELLPLRIEGDDDKTADAESSPVQRVILHGLEG